jgi:hypothetical protein
VRLSRFLARERVLATGASAWLLETAIGSITAVAMQGIRELRAPQA